MTPGDEVEDLFILLMEVKRQLPCVMAVSSGAIASDYQRLRVESVCSRLRLISLAYMWKQDQSVLLQDMVCNIYLEVRLLITSHFFLFFMSADKASCSFIKYVNTPFSSCADKPRSSGHYCEGINMFVSDPLFLC